MRYSLLIILLFASCARLSERGEKVKIIRVTPRKDVVKKELTRLFDEGCQYRGNISTSVAPGSTSYDDRLIVQLKNTVGDKGGNVVLTSLQTYGFPPKAKGKYFSCPNKMLEEYAEVDI